MGPFYKLGDRNPLPGIQNDFSGIPVTQKVPSFFLIPWFNFRSKYFLPNVMLSIMSNNGGSDYSAPVLHEDII